MLALVELLYFLDDMLGQGLGEIEVQHVLVQATKFPNIIVDLAPSALNETLRPIDAVLQPPSIVVNCHSNPKGV